MRQDDRAENDRRSRRGDRRDGLHRGSRGQRRRSEGPGRGHGLPELCPVSAPERGEEHRIPAPPARGGQGGARGQGAPSGRDPRVGRVARAQAGPALGWPAPAGGPGPGHRARADGLPHGRASLEPRRRVEGPDAGRHRGAPEPPLDDHALRDPRPGRGHDHGGPHRCDEPWGAPTGGAARRALLPARERRSSPGSSGVPG